MGRAGFALGGHRPATLAWRKGDVGSGRRTTHGSHVTSVRFCVVDRRTFLARGVALAATTAVGSSAAQTHGSYAFEVVLQRATLVGLRAPVRIAWLTDLHHGEFVRAASVRAWVDAALREAPDLVLLGGDLVDQTPGSEPDAEAFTELARLHAPLGVWAVAGNHDHARYRGIGAYAARLRDAGIEALVNRGAAVRNDLHLAGLDDLRNGRPDLAAALRDRPASGATMLLSHNPDVLPEIPLDVGLTLCGHTHGGQVVLPGVGALVTSSRYGDRFLAGWVEGPARGYVSRGLGVTSVPLRINCPAELTIFELEPA